MMPYDIRCYERRSNLLAIETVVVPFGLLTDQFPFRTLKRHQPVVKGEELDPPVVVELDVGQRSA